MSSRAFGKSLRNTTIIPLVELANHSNTDADYVIDIYKDNNIIIGEFDSNKFDYTDINITSTSDESVEDSFLDLSKKISIFNNKQMSYLLHTAVSGEISNENNIIDNPHIKSDYEEDENNLPDYNDIEDNLLFRLITGSHEGFKKNEEVSISYGRHTNRTMLIY